MRPAPAPLVFAHRGGAGDLPEHTLAAYRHSLERGVDGLECDVRLTRDGHLVCVHDPRLERTSDGRGRVSSRTLAELDALDFGSWHPGHDERSDPERSRILPLDRLLGAAREVKRPVRVLIETKHPSRYAGAVERRLIALLDRHGLRTPRPDDPVQVTVMSFSPLAVRRIRAWAPQLPTVLLWEALPLRLAGGRLPFGIRIAGPSLAWVRARPRVVRLLRAAGNQVYVWTVDRHVDVDFVRNVGVDGIITDRPAAVLDRLGR